MRRCVHAVGGSGGSANTDSKYWQRNEATDEHRAMQHSSIHEKGDVYGGSTPSPFARDRSARSTGDWCVSAGRPGICGRAIATVSGHHPPDDLSAGCDSTAPKLLRQAAAELR